jgi:hypothetical protein
VTAEQNKPLGTRIGDADAPLALALDDVVTPDRVTIWEDDFKVLHVKVDGKLLEDVRPRQTFPLSGKADYVSFMDSQGHEVLLLAHPKRLDHDSRKALERALAHLYYAAEITRVDAIGETMGVSLWHVMTNRGYAVFEVVDRQRHIRLMPAGRYVITDVDGNRFEIPDIRKLDPRSQSLVETET